MKSVQEIFSESSCADKLAKALAKSASEQYKDAFCAELNSTSCVDFPKLRMFVSDSFLCIYNFGALKYEVQLVPIADMANLYRSNVWNNEYDFKNWFLVAENAEGQRRFLASQLRRGTKNINVFDEVISCIREKRVKMA